MRSADKWFCDALAYLRAARRCEDKAAADPNNVPLAKLAREYRRRVALLVSEEF